MFSKTKTSVLLDALILSVLGVHAENGEKPYEGIWGSGRPTEIVFQDGFIIQEGGRGPDDEAPDALQYQDITPVGSDDCRLEVTNEIEDPLSSRFISLRLSTDESGDRLVVKSYDSLADLESGANEQSQDEYVRSVTPEVVPENVSGGCAATGWVRGAEPADGIAQATRAYLVESGDAAEFAVEIEKVDGDFARVLATPRGEDRDPAFVFPKREDDRWRVLVLGTGFSPDDYAKLGIPESVWL